MKILVSTHETQGYRDNDFCWVPDGEIVIPMPKSMDAPCTNETTDGACGCKRSLVGINVHRSTTTAKVIERCISSFDFSTLIADSLQKMGYSATRSDVEPVFTFIFEETSHYAPGTIVEYRDGTCWKRQRNAQEGHTK